MKTRRRGGGYTTNRNKTFEDNVRNCESTKWTKNCRKEALKYDFRSSWVGKEAREFFRENAENGINIQALSFNSFGEPFIIYIDETGKRMKYKLTEPDIRKEKWLNELGSRILEKLGPDGNPGCYVWRDNKLKLDEIRDNSNRQLYESIAGLPCIEPSNVKKWYEQGSQFFDH